MTEVKQENGTTMPSSHPKIPSEAPAAPNGATNGDHAHNPVDPEAFYSPEHLKEREERQARRDVLKQYRDPISTLPLNHCWEIPGR